MLISFHFHHIENKSFLYIYIYFKPAIHTPSNFKVATVVTAIVELKTGERTEKHTRRTAGWTNDHAHRALSTLSDITLPQTTLKSHLKPRVKSSICPDVHHIPLSLTETLLSINVPKRVSKICKLTPHRSNLSLPRGLPVL